MKVLTVIGARPEFIKAGPVTRAFANRGIEEILVHTGQHYDASMSDMFFEALGLRQPDHFLGAGSGTHGVQTARMLESIERLLLDVHPDAVLVYGDTNSTLAGGLAATKLHIPVVHVEAGLRSYNRKMPEEINRVIVDHISTLLFCPTQTGVDNLLREGIEQGVHLVGDVNQDALEYWQQSGTGRTGIVDDLGLHHGEYYVATVHRAENTDDPARLREIMVALSAIDSPVVLPVHPRTEQALKALGPALLEGIKCVPPVGFLEMLELMETSAAVLTDSGGVQKEAYMLGVPCITMRDETEWVETVDTGWNTLVGADRNAILDASRNRQPPANRPSIFGDGRASYHISDILLTGNTQ